MKRLLFLWWRFSTPLNVRVFFRAYNSPFGHEEFDKQMLRTCFNLCTELEREYIQRQGVIVCTKSFLGEG